MHIPDGIVSAEACLAGGILSLGIVLLAIKKGALQEKLPRISMIAALVFISSLMRIPMGMATVHFSFVGLAGIMLGPSSFIAVSLAVFLQWILLFHGGITTMGINMFTMGTSALAAYAVFYGFRNKLSEKGFQPTLLATLAGIIACLVKISLGSGFLITGGLPAETLAFNMLIHVPVILGEGILAGIAARYLLQFSIPERRYLIWKQTKITTDVFSGGTKAITK